MIDVDDSISKADLVDFFKETPQAAADLVRSRGQKIYSDRKTKSEKNMVVIE
jgi:hypothetical protein